MLEKLKNVFSTFVKKTLTEKNLDDAINELRILLISNDVAVDTADEICRKVIDFMKGQQINRLTSIKKTLFDILKEIITEILTPEREINIINEIEQKKSQNLPYVIVFFGIMPSISHSRGAMSSAVTISLSSSLSSSVSL